MEAHFLKRLKNGIVAEEKRWTLRKRAQHVAAYENSTKSGAQERLELALGVVRENESESDPARTAGSATVGLTGHSQSNSRLHARVLKGLTVEELATEVEGRVDEERAELHETGQP